MAQVNGIVVWTEGIKAELAKRLPKQRKTQRDKLAVLVATMLHVRSANLVELAQLAQNRHRESIDSISSPESRHYICEREVVRR